ncbi:MAG: mechanosensitive ion channel family protein [Propionibacteriaceae bacterium]|jgi:small conductance mechanosensitive channel|nr:mechanosensitive ion channel family protein [Propionibacteriaceae bacterium]
MSDKPANQNSFDWRNPHSASLEYLVTSTLGIGLSAARLTRMTPLALTWNWPQTPITLGVILAAAVLAHLVVVTIIKRVTKRMRRLEQAPESGIAKKAASALTQVSGSRPGRTVVHVTALAHLARSIWTITLVVVVILMLMSTLGIPLTPILASAGIGGVVLAFGAQSLIKDYLSGIAMIIEDQYGVGDQINVGEITGTVEDITLRITKLRDAGGMIWYIRNGEILRVGNVSQGYSTGLIDVPVAYDADVAQVTAVLNQVLAEVSANPDLSDKLLEEPTLLGVESITATTLTMRIRIKTPPNQQYDLVRSIREAAIAALNAAGIPGPVAVPFIEPTSSAATSRSTPPGI